MDKLDDRYVNVMCKQRALDRDIDLLRDHIASFSDGAKLYVGVLACILSASELLEALIMIETGMRSEKQR